MSQELYDKAESFLVAAYRKDQRNPSVCFMLGKVLSRHERSFNDAVSMYLKGLTLDPLHVQGYIDLANLYLRVGNKKEAIQVLEIALQRNPDAQELRAEIDNLKKRI
jgi:predicted Zn-dependent protease